MAEMAAKVQALGAGLRPEPHRGDVVAAGAVVLAALVALLQVRFDGAWATGVHLACCAAALAFVAALALRAPREGAEPRTYQSVLLATTFALAVPTLGRLAQALGVDGLGSAHWPGSPAPWPLWASRSRRRAPRRCACSSAR
jgi:hypothetical protein